MACLAPRRFSSFVRQSRYTKATTSRGKAPSLGGRAETGGVDGGSAVVQLETNLDDCTAQVIAYASEQVEVEEKEKVKQEKGEGELKIVQLLRAGALDVWTSPITMKKGRLGVMLSVLCRTSEEEALTNIIFEETTTLGIRRFECERTVLERLFEEVETEWGIVSVKIGILRGKVVNVQPEYEHAASAAKRHGVAVKKVMKAAVEGATQVGEIVSKE